MSTLIDRLQGAMPALVTPFRDGQLDEAALANLVQRQIDHGSRVMIPAGTTGESVTLTPQDYARVLAITVEVAQGRVPVIAGAGGNDTAKTIALAQSAQAAGVDGLLVVTPYYNKPSPAGLLAHYQALGQAVDLPMVLYNVPGRTGIDMSPDTVAAIAKAIPQVVGIKDATGDMGRLALTRGALGGRAFAQISGDDPSVVGFVAHGGVGSISVTANVAPALYAQMMTAALAGDFATARALDDRLAPLHKALFSDASPGPAKYALAQLGLCTPEVRLPLVEISDAAKAQVDAALRVAGL